MRWRTANTRAARRALKASRPPGDWRHRGVASKVRDIEAAFAILANDEAMSEISRIVNVPVWMLRGEPRPLSNLQ